MNPQAKHAIRAARLFKQCGREASYLYARKMLSPANMRLYFLARTLEAAKGVKYENY